MSNRRKLPRPKKTDDLVLSDKVQQYIDQHNSAGHYNGYRCRTCNTIYVTLDIDSGVTPMLMRCFATEDCDGQAISLGYPSGALPSELGQPVLEWYRPASLRGLNPEMVDHLKQGGLMHRPAPTAPDWVKAEHGVVA